MKINLLTGWRHEPKDWRPKTPWLAYLELVVLIIVFVCAVVEMCHG